MDFTQPDLNMQQCRWVQLLHEYDFTIEYKAGKKDVVTDALSRISTLTSVTVYQSTLIDEVINFMVDDMYFDKSCKTILSTQRTEKQEHLMLTISLVKDILARLQQEHKAMQSDGKARRPTSSMNVCHEEQA